MAKPIIAIVGRPNVGKSTVFNRLTGLRQHTGNWPGKTVERAEGYFSQAGQRFRLVDLPGTYSLAADSPEEEVAGAFLQSGQAVTITSAPVASSCAATDRAICTCWPSEMAVLATEEPQQRAFSRVEAGSSNSPTASITARGSS